MIEFLLELDQKLLLLINGWNSPFFDRVMWWISGKYSWWPFYLLLISLVFYFKGWKKGGLLVLFVIIAITLSDQTSVHLFKNTIQRLRPTHNPEIENMLHIVQQYRGGTYGFISSHATNSFSVAVLLSLVIRKPWFSLMLFTWAVLVSYSRIYLGVHYPGDILGGAVWGSLIGLMLAYLYRRFVEEKKERARKKT